LYSNGKLLMITPTAFYGRFSDMGDYVYRMLPTNKEFIKPLAKYASENDRRFDRVVVYEDQRSIDNGAVATAFRDILGQAKVSIEEYDSASTDAEIAKKLAQFKQAHVNSVLIAPHIEHMDDAMRIAQAAKRQNLTLLGTSTFFADNILGNPTASQVLEGMVFYTPWSPTVARQNIFSSHWNKHVTWRTATSYDTFQLVATGLAAEFQAQGQTTRGGIHDFFKQYQDKRRYTGTTGVFQFTDKGERTGKLDYGELLEIKRVAPAKWQFCSVDRPQECPTAKP
jgi:branched-chain amino acid transport system substrate-binding protein